MTALADLLIRRIAAGGPITLADYMADCLLHPDHGYYTRAEPFGAAGDFITAPEISQMFGELLGLWLAQCWLDQGAPAFTLAELGPGRGTLMADVLRATRGVPGFHAAAQVALVEASPRLRAIQQTRLAPHPVTWADSLDALPDGPLFLLANEFFDALPVRQFARAGNGWAETMVTVQDGALALARATPAPLAALAHRLADTREDDIVETCPAAPGIAQAIATRIAHHGGAALIVDYGGWHSLGDTVQAMKAHGYCSLLDTPGQADITAHVDFEPLARAALAGGATVHGPVAQGALLERLGIAARAARLAQALSGDGLASHTAATRRLTHPDEMGTLFQALAILPASAPLPAGFAQ
ncbi:class I SAM-dependent methyltransferase [Gemmobacter sp.]|uniref:class I SAM-dependent methyltransferase n=1 Tax=Gemmobacter sp. TaxID=1898957 RepID=UPI002AFEFDD3|nr:SAM-dependent methyltransferase [Gemmobacter sp.]